MTSIKPQGLPDYTSQTATQYKASIDAGIAAGDRLAWAFVPHQQDTPNMTVQLEAGHIFTGATLTEIDAQSTSGLLAPTGNPRIDRVVVDRLSGDVSVVTGTEAANPTPPDIPSGKVPIAQIHLAIGSPAITNSMIIDERNLGLLGSAGESEVSVASASTVDLGAQTSHSIVITGNTGPITSFGNAASLDSPYYFVRFTGTPTLTNSASLILPGGTNLTIAAGDWLISKFEGSSVWRIVSCAPADGRSIKAFMGDSGSGGTKGLVPAPAVGDAAANKFLNASGAWAATPDTGVTSIAAGAGLTGGTITSTGTVALDTTAGNIGTYALAKKIGNGTFNFGSTTAGSTLSPVNTNNSASGTLSGTWRCMGYLGTIDCCTPSGNNFSTLWQRIS